VQLPPNCKVSCLSTYILRTCFLDITDIATSTDCQLLLVSLTFITLHLFQIEVKRMQTWFDYYTLEGGVVMCSVAAVCLSVCLSVLSVR